MSIIRRKNGNKVTYEVDVYLSMVDGKRKRIIKTFDKYAEARDFESQQLNFKKNIRDVNISERVLFSEVASQYIKQCGLKDNSIRSYKSKLKIWIEPQLGLFQVGNINQLTLSRFFQIVKSKGASVDTIYVIKCVLDAIFKYANSAIVRYISENPMDFIPDITREDRGLKPDAYWNKNEAEKFLRSAKDTPYYNLFLFMLNAGPRIGEVAALTKDNFNLDAKILKITNQLSVYLAGEGEERLPMSAYYLEQTKSSRHRIVPLNKTAIKAVREEIENGQDNLFIFCPGDTEEKLVVLKRGNKAKTIMAKHVTDKTVSYTLKRICKMADVKYIGPHGLRHTFSANFLMNGGDIYTLSKLLGHKNVQTTISYYGHLSNEFLQSASRIVSFEG